MGSSSGIAQILPKLPLVFVGLFVLTMLGAILFALVRGVGKARVRLIILVGCLALAFIITAIAKGSAGFAYSRLEGSTQSLFTSDEAKDFFELISNSEPLQETLLGFATALVAPLFFTLVFIALRIVTEIIYFIVMLFVGGALRAKDKERKFPKLRKWGLGIAQGLLIFFVLMTPFYAYLSIALPIVDTALEQEEVQESVGQSEEVQAVRQLAANTQNNFFFKTYGALGGKATCNFLTSFTSGGEKTTIVKEVNAITKMIREAAKLKDVKGTDDMTEETAEVVRNLMSNIGDSKMVRTIFGEAIYAVTDAWQNDRTIFGVAKPDMGTIMNPLLDVIIDDFHKDARDSAALEADFGTLGNMISIMAKANLFKSMANGSTDTDAMIESLASGTLIKDLITALGSNNTLKNLIPEFANLGMRAIGSSVLNLPENAAEIYDQYIKDITAAVNAVLASDATDEAKIDELAQKITEALDKAGLEIELDTSVVKLYANAILTEVRDAGITHIDEEDIREFFEIFSELNEEKNQQNSTAPLAATAQRASEKVYTSRLYGGKTKDDILNSAVAKLATVTQEIAKASAEAANEEAFQQQVAQIMEDHGVTVTLSGLTKDSFTQESLKTVSTIKEGTFPTVRITMEEFLIDTKRVSDALTGDAVEQEAEKINSIFTAAISVKNAFADTENFDLDKLGTIANNLGSMLDSLESTDTFEGKTSKMITAIFQKEEVAKSMDMDIRTATKLAKAATESADGSVVNYAETMKSVSTGASIATKLGDPDATITEAEVGALLESMTPQTAEMLKVYLTEDRVENYGIQGVAATTSVRLLNAMFTEMATEYVNYEAEKNALVKMFEVAKAASTNTSEEAPTSLFNHGDVKGKLDLTAAETVALVMDSKMVRNAVEAAMYDENGEIDEEMKNPFGLTIPTGEPDYQECVAAIEAYHEAHPDDLTTLKAFAAFFGVEANFLD